MAPEQRSRRIGKRTFILLRDAGFLITMNVVENGEVEQACRRAELPAI
jgi:hypothetical protein